MLTPDSLRRCLRYDPKTGDFTWLVRPNSRVRSGALAGTINDDGVYKRRSIQINGQRYTAHRLAWFYMTDKWPVAEIDHIDRNPLNNKWSNLRQSSRRQNVLNSGPVVNKTLPVGVRKRFNRFHAERQIGGRIKFLGAFATPEAAHQAYLNAKI